MSIFRRRSGETGEERTPERTPRAETAPDGVAEPAAEERAGPEGADGAAGAGEVVAGVPQDAGELDGPGHRIDLGSLWVSGIPGMELRLEVEQESGEVTSAHVVMGESVLQLQAFAAPRTLGIWEDVRTEIAQSITSLGGTADEAEGRYGTELRTRMPQAGPDGRTVFAPARFIGIDGPRWFLRGVFSGPAAIDDDLADGFAPVLGDLVVVRGEDPMAPREVLPLRVPEQLAGDAADGQGDEQGAEQPADAADGAGPDPFRRGPEITEVR